MSRSICLSLSHSVHIAWCPEGPSLSSYLCACVCVTWPVFQCRPFCPWTPHCWRNSVLPLASISHLRNTDSFPRPAAIGLTAGQRLQMIPAWLLSLRGGSLLLPSEPCCPQRGFQVSVWLLLSRELGFVVYGKGCAHVCVCACVCMRAHGLQESDGKQTGYWLPESQDQELKLKLDNPASKKLHLWGLAFTSPPVLPGSSHCFWHFVDFLLPFYSELNKTCGEKSGSHCYKFNRWYFLPLTSLNLFSNTVT